MLCRTMTRSARGFADRARFSLGVRTSVSGSSLGLASASHSSSRLESVCRTTSPSHSTRSSSSSVRADVGTVERSAR